jgi:glycosyltransferase involved in cell wall biosynthesis
MKIPFVSVIVPTYNRAAMLRDCIKAIRGQDYPLDRYELIVVDDGSADETEAVLEEFSDWSSLKVLKQDNRGSYAARNLAISKTEGDILLCTDDDCIVSKEWITKIVDDISKENSGVVGGRIIGHQPETIVEKYINKNRLLDQSVFLKVFPVTANVAYKREVFEKAGVFDEQFRSGGDVDMGIRAKVSGYEIVYSPEAMIEHRHRSNLMGLIRQFFGYGRGYSLLHGKYRKNFNPGRRIMHFVSLIVKKLILIPYRIIRAPFKDDHIVYVLEHPLDIVLSISEMAGLAYEIIFGKGYQGQSFEEYLGFIKEAKIGGGWGL